MKGGNINGHMGTTGINQDFAAETVVYIITLNINWEASKQS